MSSLEPRIAARRILKDCKKKTFPVDLKEIIKASNFNIHIREADLDKLDGFTSRKGEIYLISIDPSFPYARRRFTTAHEIGHILLRHHDDLITHPKIQEYEANLFASELLMPAPFFYRVMHMHHRFLTSYFGVSREALEIRKERAERECPVAPKPMLYNQMLEYLCMW